MMDREVLEEVIRCQLSVSSKSRRNIVVSGLIAVSVMVVLCLVSSGFGQGSTGSKEVSASDSRMVDFDTQADYMNYDADTGWITAKGNVVITRQGYELRANYVRANKLSGQAYTRGRFRLKRQGQADLVGEDLRGNFKTDTWMAKGMQGTAEPFKIIKSDGIRRYRGDRVVAENAIITTCEKKHPHFHVKAKKVDVIANDRLKAYGATWYFGRVPVMYMPYWYRDLQGDFGWSFQPGYSSRMGYFLLSSYRYRINPNLKGRTHLDYRTRRGWAVGQDFRWRDPGRYYGDVRMYYADDQEPWDSDDDPVTSGIDSDRYRIKLTHSHDYSPRDNLQVELQYLSDTDMLEDFFEREYRRRRQPENRVTFTHREDSYTITLEGVGRLNDFYENVNRLPEVSVDFSRQVLGESRFYYEGETAMAFLERVHPENETDKEDYSVVRIDTAHRFYRPMKWFGFLTMIPRVGYRGTHYSDTLERTYVTNNISTTNTIVIGGITNISRDVTSETNPVYVAQGADLRSLYEIGLEMSFKAFRTWDGGIRPVRHIIQPYANYTFVPEPELVAENIYQFDGVDSLGESHKVRVGARNKIQTKRDQRPRDIIDLDTYTIVNLDTEEGEDAIENAYFDLEFTPTDYVKLEADGVWDVDQSEFSYMTTRLRVSEEDSWSTSLQYRYRRDRSRLLIAALDLYPGEKWAFGPYMRYEMEKDELQEAGGYLQRMYDCMVLKASTEYIPGYARSGVGRDDEWKVAIEFWLTAFPEFRIAG